MVSYVLLIVIAMSIAAGVFSWLKFYVPSQTDSQKCNDEAAIAITDYACSNHLLNLTIENKFNDSFIGGIQKLRLYDTALESNEILTKEDAIKYITSFAAYTPINMDRETGAKKKVRIYT